MTPDGNALVRGIASRQPEFTAQVLEALSGSDAQQLLVELPVATASSVLACMLPRHAAACVKQMNAEQLGPIVSRLRPTVAASFLRLLRDEELQGLLSRLPERTTLPLRYLLRYSQSMVGAWMEAGGFLLPVDLTVGEALERARMGDRDLDRMLFVVDREQKLYGAVPATALLRQSAEKTLREIVMRVPFSLRGRADLNTAGDHPGWQNWDPMPVVDRDKRVVGLLRYSDLRSGLVSNERNPDEPVHRGASVGELLELSWQGLADLLDGALLMAPEKARRHQVPGEGHG